MSSNSDYNVSVKFDAKTGKFNSDVKNLEKSMGGLERGTKKAAAANTSLAKSADITNAKLSTTNKLAQSVKMSLLSMAAGFGAFQIGTSLVRELGAFQDIRTRLQGLSTDLDDYAEKEAWIISLSERHHKEINGLADGYSRLSALVQENIVSDDQARVMLEGLSNAASQNGAGVEDLERVYYGLSQALGAGTVNMEDFKQVTEPLPDLMSKIAKAAGFETSAGLKELIGTGTLTSEVFGTYLVKALGKYDGAAAKTANNINSKISDIKREFTLLAVALEEPLTGITLPGLDAASFTLKALKNNVDIVIGVLEVGLVVAAGHAITAIGNKTAATIVSSLASRRAALATLEQARSEHALALAFKASAVGSVQASIADTRLIASRKALTVATRATAVAARGASAAMALVGGPVGVALLAAYAIATFATSASDAARESTNLADKLGLAEKKLTDLSVKQLKLRLFDLENDPAAEIDKARLRALKAQEEYIKVNEARGFKNKEGDKKTLERDVEIEALNAKFAKLTTIKEKIAELLATPASAGNNDKPEVQGSKVLDVYKDQEEALKRQIGLMGATTEYARILWETKSGKYSELLPNQKDELINLAKISDAKKKALDDTKEEKTETDALLATAQNYAMALYKKSEVTSEASEVAKLAYEIEHGALQGINEELEKRLTLLAQNADATAALAEADLPFWEQLKEHVADSTQDFDTMWGNTFNNFASNIGDAVGTAVVEGENLSDSMRNIAKSVAKEVISSLVQIGVKRLALSLIDKSVNKVTAVSAAAAMTSQATGMSLMAGLNAFSSTAAIPIVGPFAAPGAMAAALAVTAPMAAGVATSAASMAGMAHDGIDSIPTEGTWLLDKGERVVDQRTNGDLKDFLGKKTGNSSNSAQVNLTIQAPDDSQGAEMIMANRELIFDLIIEAQNEMGKDF